MRSIADETLKRCDDSSEKKTALFIEYRTFRTYRPVLKNKRNQIVPEMKRQDIITKTGAHTFFPVWVRQRELNEQLPLRHSDTLYKSLYTSISPYHSWDGGETSRSEHGGIFSLEFSPDGTHLLAGCQNNSFLMVDPLSRRLIRTVHNVHASYVSQVKFLDSKIFATGGDDGTVSLWDTRNLKSRCQTLPRHSATIVNIEFSRKNDMVITSAIDGFICIWDMKNWNQIEECNNSTFMSHVVLRLRLNSDETKMVISTANGYLLIVHELDLNTIVEDLVNFEMELFGFGYVHQTNSDLGENSTRILSQNRRRNRVEVVSDFPNAGAFHVISALEIHPQGWSAFSRSKDEARKQEWTCVHDIQKESGIRTPQFPRRLESINEERLRASGDRRGTGSLGEASVVFCMQSSNDSGSELQNSALSLKRGAREGRPSSLAVTALARSSTSDPSFVPPELLELDGLWSNPASCRALDLALPRPNPSVAQLNRRDHVRFPRLTHYIEDSYSSEWYIENMGVSADGRLLCSPFERGIRLLAFSPECSEQSISWCETNPKLFYELRTHTLHSESVICTKFSPRHPLVVSGCVDGTLAWYQPVV